MKQLVIYSLYGMRLGAITHVVINFAIFLMIQQKPHSQKQIRKKEEDSTM